MAEKDGNCGNHYRGDRDWRCVPADWDWSLGGKGQMKILCFILGFICALALLFLLNVRAVAAARRRRKREIRERPEKKMQATKIIVFSVMATYYIAFAVAVWVVLMKDIYQLSTLLAFVGSVAVFAVAFYCWKSKAENLEKIKQGNPEMEASLSDFSGMASQ